ncbi:MAG: radical SAM protein [Candidatus Aenigmatarchaeota archaeon]
MVLDVLIVDGYVDEPSLLGVPPYLAPQPRMLAGVCEEHNLDWGYITADEYREEQLPLARKIVVYGGVTVPGNYLSGTPLSSREAEEIAGHSGETFLGGPLARYHDIKGYDHYAKKNLSACLCDHLNGEEKDRWAGLEERKRWLKRGAVVVEKHPMYPDPLLAEIRLYRGCVRYFTGGCSFCSEPDYGKPEFREQRDVVAEIKELYDLGVRHFRIGGQSCTVSYKARGLGNTETPEPQPKEIEKLFDKLWENCPEIKVLHLDNANPAVIASHPDKSREVLEILKDNTTSGNVLALGMESADPGVIEASNLNSAPKQVRKAIEMINEVGRERGENGMPKLLPGINFLGGLEGESPETYEKNFGFLKELLKDDLLLRRINIRQAISPSGEIDTEYKKEFREFKKRVRKQIDQPMLKNVVPKGTVLKNVYLEKRDGKKTFGRQIGSYPLLVGVEYPLELGNYYDIIVTDHGYRSITGLHHPFYLDKVKFSQLKAVPGIGAGRAAKIFEKQPDNRKELSEIIEDKDQLEEILKYSEFSR